MKLFTCGELKQLTFNSYDYDCIVNRPNAKHEEGEMVPNVDRSLEYDLYKNTKSIRNEKSEEDRTAITRISSQARIAKVDGFEDLAKLGLKLDKDTKEIKIDQYTAEVLAMDKIDGIYITKTMAEKLSEFGYQKKEHLRVLNPEVVSRGNEKHKSKQRSYIMSPEIKKITDDINRNYKQYKDARMYNRGHRPVSVIGGTVYRSVKQADGREKLVDITPTIENIEKYINTMYEEGMKPGGMLENTGIKRPEIKRGYNNCSANIGSRRVIMDPCHVVKRYLDLKDNPFIDSEIRDKIQLPTVAKAIYYHEVGHIKNNEAMNIWRSQVKLDEIKPGKDGIKEITMEHYRDYLNYRMTKERQATDYAINQIMQDKSLKVDKDAAVKILSTSLHTYDYDGKKQVCLKQGSMVSIGEERYRLVENKKRGMTNEKNINRFARKIKNRIFNKTK